MISVADKEINDIHEILELFHLLDITKYLGNISIVICFLKNPQDSLFDFGFELRFPQRLKRFR